MYASKGTPGCECRASRRTNTHGRACSRVKARAHPRGSLGGDPNPVRGKVEGVRTRIVVVRALGVSILLPHDEAHAGLLRQIVYPLGKVGLDGWLQLAAKAARDHLQFIHFCLERPF